METFLFKINKNTINNTPLSGLNKISNKDLTNHNINNTDNKDNKDLINHNNTDNKVSTNNIDDFLNKMI